MRKFTFETDRCGKMRFATRAGAEVSARNKGEKHATTFAVYYCRRCLGFHLTTKR